METYFVTKVSGGFFYRGFGGFRGVRGLKAVQEPMPETGDSTIQTFVSNPCLFARGCYN